MAWHSGGATHAAMVEALVRNRLITSDVVREAFLATDRAWFVPPAMRHEAYADHPLPIGYHVTISAPHMHAAMAEIIAKHFAGKSGGAGLAGRRVLDVGSGSGFLTAVLAHMVGPAGQVYGVEHVPELVAASKASIAACTAHAAPTKDASAATQAAPITIAAGDGRSDALPAGFPPTYDAIHVGAAAPGRAPAALLRRLEVGGCLVIPIDDELHVITRTRPAPAGTGDDSAANFVDAVAMGVRFVPLTSLQQQLGGRL